MDFESIEVDDDLLAMLDNTRGRPTAPAPPPPAPAPVEIPTSSPELTSSPPKPLGSSMQARPGRWIPGASLSTVSAPVSAPPPAAIIPSSTQLPQPVTHQVGPLTKESIGGASSLQIELSYGGKARIRVTVSAQASASVFVRKSPFQKAVVPEKLLINAATLPPFIKAAFTRTTTGQIAALWDVSCTDPTWPAYEEMALDLQSRTSSVLAHWLFPSRVLPQLDVNLRRAVEEETANQLQVPYASRVSVRYTSLPDYVRKLVLECCSIYREAERAVNTPAPNASPLSLQISSILPQHLMQTELFRALKDYQVKGVEFAYCRKGRLLLADAPGLGKTLQAIAIASCYAEDWPVLVICPSSVRAMWANEFERWVPGLTFADISTNFTGKRTSLKAKVNVISYELLKSPKIIESVWSFDPRTSTQQHPFGVIICDECHLLKTFKSARTQAILPLVQKAKRAIMLSGTPATSRPSELHTQLSAIQPRVFQFFPSFGDRYCDPKPSPFGNGYDYSGASNTHELYLLLTEALMIRRHKSEVLGDMPTKRRHQLLLEIPKETREALVNMAKELRRVSENIGSAPGFGAKGRKAKKTASKDDEAIEDSSMDISSLRGRQHNLVLEMFQNAGRAKLPSAIAHLMKCLETEPADTKFLVFGHHKDILGGFSHALRENGVEFIRIDGSTTNTSRQPLVDHFQNTPSCRVAVLSIMAAGVGITLTRASKVFFAELFWDPAALLQAEDRAHRYGQNKDVDVYYMIAKGSYDEKLWDAVDMKLSVLSAVLDAKKAQLSVDSVSRDSGAESTKAADSFIGYLLQKIDGFFERTEDFQERSQTRRKARDGTFFQDDPIETGDEDAADKRKSPPLKTTSSSRDARAPKSVASNNSAPLSSHAPAAAHPSSGKSSKNTVIDLDLEDDDEDSIEALLREPVFKKSAPLPAPQEASSTASSTLELSPSKEEFTGAITAETEQKRMDKLARFAMLD